MTQKEMEYFDVDPDFGYDEEIQELDEADDAREFEEWEMENEFNRGTNEYIEPWEKV